METDSEEFDGTEGETAQAKCEGMITNAEYAPPPRDYMDCEVCGWVYSPHACPGRISD